MNQKKQNNLLPIIMMFALFAMISFVTNLASPFGNIAKDQFDASNLMSQFGNLANFIAYAFMGIPAGILLKRNGYKFTALLAIAVGLSGVGIMYISGMVESFTVYILGAFVAGFSMCMLNTVVNPMLNTLGGGGKTGNQLIQFGGALNSLAGTFSPVFVGMLVGEATKASIADANPALFIAMGIFALAFFVLAFVRIPEPHIEKKDKNAPKVKDKHSALSFRHFKLGALAIFVYVGVEVGIAAFIINYLSAPVAEGGFGLGKDIATSVAGMYWLLMMFGRIFGGIVAARVSPRAMLAAVAGLAALFVAIGIFLPDTSLVSVPALNSATFTFTLISVPMSILLFVLCGLCTSVMWGGIFNLAVEGLGKKYTAMGSGIFMVMVCGGGILPVIQGQVADMFGYMASYWVIVAGCAYMLYFALIGSRNVNKNIPVE
ncbi:MAG: MFS transporter [Rikenellaceae bacterium]